MPPGDCWWIAAVESNGRCSAFASTSWRGAARQEESAMIGDSRVRFVACAHLSQALGWRYDYLSRQADGLAPARYLIAGPSRRVKGSVTAVASPGPPARRDARPYPRRRHLKGAGSGFELCVAP